MRKIQHSGQKKQFIFSVILWLTYQAIYILIPTYRKESSFIAAGIYIFGSFLIHSKTKSTNKDAVLEYALILLIYCFLIFNTFS